MSKVLHADMRGVKMCNNGGRKFFARHNLDWDDFRKNGIDIDILERIDDAMANKVIAAARERIKRES